MDIRAGGEVLAWGAGAVALGVAALASVWARRGAARAPRRPGGAGVYVLVTRLAGDRGDRLGARLRATLAETLGPAAVGAWRHRPPDAMAAGDRDERTRVEAGLLAAARRAGADAVVWGGVDAADGGGLVRVAATDPRRAAAVIGVAARVAAQGFAPGVGEGFAALVAEVAGDDGATAERWRAALADHAARPDAALSGADRCRLREMHARLTLDAFAAGGDAARVEEAVAVARLAVCDGRAATAPAEAAAAQALLARALAVWAGAQAQDAAALEAVWREVAQAYRAALAGPGAWTRGEFAALRLAFAQAVAEWAQRTQGAALVEEALVAAEAAVADVPAEQGEAAILTRARIRAVAGERLGGAARLEAAVAGYADALKTLDPEADPTVSVDAWAAAQVGLGRALTALGARRQGVETLTAAVAAFDAVLARSEGVGAARAPSAVDWAAVHAARGEALAALGERAGDSAASLTAAATALRAAITQSEARGGARLAADARRTLARVERLLAERRAASASASSAASSAAS